MPHEEDLSIVEKREFKECRSEERREVMWYEEDLIVLSAEDTCLHAGKHDVEWAVNTVASY